MEFILQLERINDNINNKVLENILCVFTNASNKISGTNFLNII